MSKLLRCPDCGGRKNIIGMGLMGKPCKKCNAVGWINRPAEEFTCDETSITTKPGVAVELPHGTTVTTLGNVPRETNLIDTAPIASQGEFTSVQEPELSSFPAQIRIKGRPKAKVKGR